jgi:alanine-glyoxylate transaminase/serine-glyoxylate transaminase/serine-pyruvate transaminase
VLELNVTEPAERSDSVTTLIFNDGRNPRPLLDYCNRNCAVVLGIGIGALSGKALRIAHMGHINAPMVLGTLGGLETGLIALGIPHGQGALRAATEWLADSVPA